MKIPCTLKNALLIIRNCFGLSFASKGLGYLAALLLLLSLLARYKFSCYQTTLPLTILALAYITLLKTTCHFLLLRVGFDTLTYRKELQLIPYTCGSSMGEMYGKEKSFKETHWSVFGVFCFSEESKTRRRKTIYTGKLPTRKIRTRNIFGFSFFNYYYYRHGK